ncbi:MAG: phosphoserine phosphatase [Gaiellales bacterium]|jgi:broad specificity phosphatase PhoE|nr:phosphoserine phosphatase [Gaiellales bacterium]
MRMLQRLILIRHGETIWNHERRFTTRTDVALSETGLEQARAAAEALAEVSIDRIYSSPLERAVRTAEIIAARQGNGCSVNTDARLVEIDAGPFEGLTEEELKAGPLAPEFARWHTDGEPEFPPGCEPFDDALARASAFLDQHVDEPGTTLVATHGSLARLIVSSHFLGGPPPFHRRLWLDNCRLAVFEWRGGVPKLIAFNVERV